MRLDPEDGPIQLGLLEAALCASIVELRYLPAPTYALPFSPEHPPAVLRPFIASFQDVVTADVGWEAEARRGLAFLLNLEDASLLRFARRLDLAYPSGCATEIRCFLRILWHHTFADWRDPDFSESEYRLSEF